ncbi:MAG: metal ABC transporter substrate-binding protein [Candidatus Krumholzibacteriia bacterium]
MKAHRNLRRALWLLAAAGVIAASPVSARGQDKLEVVTTLSILEYLAREVGGERVEVQSLGDPRQDPHFVQPRPTLMKKTRDADVFIEVGLQLELWAQKVIDGAGNPSIQAGQPGRIVASAGISTMELPEVLSREWGDVHPYGNPHVWLDPVNVKRMAENIANGLAAVDGAHAEHYARRLAAFNARLDNALFGERLVADVGARKLTRLAERGRLFEYVDSKGLSAQLGGWLKKAEALRGKQVVTYHKTWIYFARRFGLDIALEIEEKPGITPSAKHRDHVIRTVTQNGIKVLLLSSFYNRSSSDYIAGRTGASVVAVPIDLGAAEGVNTYFELMDYLISQIGGPLEGGA